MNDEQRLVEENTGLVYMTIAQLYRQGRLYSWEIEDMAQEGRIGLLRAARTYKPDVGVSFSTYATKCIRNEIGTRLEEMSRERRAGNRKHLSIEQVVIRGDRRGEIHLGDVIPSGMDVEAEALGITMEEIHEMLERIGQSEWYECLKRNAEGETLAEIGKSKGVSKQHIGQMVQNARSVVRREVQRREND